jgi:hypothetical protein
MFWVATHRIHHQFADKDGDPHTPRDGKWWSHIGWMLVGNGTHCDIDQCFHYAPGYLQGSIPGLALEVPLSAAGHLKYPAVGFWRAPVSLRGGYCDHAWARDHISLLSGAAQSTVIRLIRHLSGNPLQYSPQRGSVLLLLWTEIDRRRIRD